MAPGCHLYKVQEELEWILLTAPEDQRHGLSFTAKAFGVVGRGAWRLVHMVSTIGDWIVTAS